MAQETQETIVQALRRLVSAASRESSVYNTCSISETEGRAYDRLIATTVKYPFGFEANIGAAQLGKVLPLLTDPTVRTTDRQIVFEDNGSTFRLMKTDAEVVWPKVEKPKELVEVEGPWLRRLLPCIPAKTETRNSLAGLSIGPEGYAGTDGANLGSVSIPGPTTEAIIPRELAVILARQPTAMLGVSQKPLAIWAETEAGIWTCPPLAATFPNWKGILKETPNVAVVKKDELIYALRACNTVATNANLVITKEATGVSSHREASDMDASNVDAPLDHVSLQGSIKICITSAKVLAALETIESEVVQVATIESQKHLYIRCPDVNPETIYLFAGMRWSGDL